MSVDSSFMVEPSPLESVGDSSESFLRMALPYDLSEDEVGYFVKAVKTDDHAGGVDKVVENINSGRMQLWVWRDSGSVGVWVTEIIQHYDGESEMLLSMLAGNSMIQSYFVASDLMVDKAREAGCKRLVAYVKPNILGKLREAALRSGISMDFNELYVVIAKEA